MPRCSLCKKNKPIVEETSMLVSVMGTAGTRQRKATSRLCAECSQAEKEFAERSRKNHEAEIARLQAMVAEMRAKEQQ